MKIDKDDITALFGTIIIHLIVLILLYFGVLRSFVPIDDGSIPVIFGDVYATVGTYQPPAPIVQPPRTNPPPTPVKPTPQPNKKLITQEKEKTVAVPEATKNNDKSVANEAARKEKEEADRQRKVEDERKRKEAEEQRKQQEEAEAQRKQQEAISNRVSNAFGTGSSQEDPNAATARATNQGSPFGNSDTGLRSGTGGVGTFNLSGRTIGSGGLPRPDYTSQEDGRIVIDITVDPNGNVVSVRIGRGTNIGDTKLRDGALDAAKRAKFNKIQSTNNQNGTITYNYKLN